MQKRVQYIDIAKRQFTWKIFLSLTSAEGILAFFFILYAPSEGKNALLWGYSAERLVLGAAILAILIVFIILTVNAWCNTRIHFQIIAWLDKSFSISENLRTAIVWTLFGCALTLGVGFLVISPLAIHLNDLRFYLIRGMPIILWSAAALAQAAIVLRISYAELLEDRMQMKDIFKLLLLPLMLALTFAHWAILSFRIQLFTIIDGWYWQFRFKETPNLWMFFLIAVLSIIVVIVVLKHPRHTKRNIILLIVLGYFLQLSFGFTEADRLDAISTKYSLSGHKSYALYAADRPPLENIFLHYEEIYGVDQYAGTKPPGVILFYVLTQRASALFFPQDSYDLRLSGLMTFITYLYPLIACLTLPILYRFSRLFLDAEKAIFPPLLYIFFPNFLLMPLFLDQVLYPLLFILTLDLVLRALIQRSPVLAFCAGVAIYVTVYFTFSLLPLLFLALVLIGVFYLSQQNKKIKDYLALIIGLFAGLLIAFAFFRLFLHYTPLLRYTNAITYHRDAKSFQSGMKQILSASLLNNIDFAVSIGFPIAILSLIRGGRAIGAFLKRHVTYLDVVTLAFGITYLALLIVGQTRGEVGRLWLYLAPLLAIFSSIEAHKLFHRPKQGIYLVIALQLSTTMFIFKFQDFFA